MIIVRYCVSVSGCYTQPGVLLDNENIQKLKVAYLLPSVNLLHIQHSYCSVYILKQLALAFVDFCPAVSAKLTLIMPTTQPV